MTDQELLDRVKQNDDRAITTVYNRIKPYVQRMVFIHGGNSVDVDEVMQETMLRVVNKVRDEEITLTSKITTFIYGFALRVWTRLRVDRYRLDQRFVTIDGRDFVDDNNQQLYLGDPKGILEKTINSLPPQQQKLIRARYYDLSTMEVIAKKMKYNNTDTAKSRKAKAFAKLKREIVLNHKIEEFYN